MITVINTIQLSKPITLDEARGIFLSTAPGYQNVPGLIRKTYTLSKDGSTVGGIYLWNSREEADAMYTNSWSAFVREKYGADPSLIYLESPVVFDNTVQKIIADE